MRVEFVNLKAQYLSIKEEIDAAMREVVESTAFSGGPFVEAFEGNFARAQGARYCIAVSSGTAALHAALWAAGIGPGDEVIVPANTFIATAEAVCLTGAVPVFADCEPEFYNIDPERLDAALSERTRAVIAVHLYGQPARLDKLLAFSRNHNLLLIEDCAQAHLATFNDSPVGTFGFCGCFSFYPGKNLGAYGEGGAVVTNSDVLSEKLKGYRDHGSSRKYHHDEIGHNYRMDGIQGAVLDVKLRHLAEWTRIRRRNADLYAQHLAGVEEVELPREDSPDGHVFHLYVIRTAARDQLMAHLAEHEISTGIHYPIPCHLQKAFDHLGYKEGSLPVAEALSKTILSLPMSADLTEEEIIYTTDTIKKFYHAGLA